MATDPQALLELLVRHGYLLVFLAGLAEGLPLVGVLVPGQAVILVAGALAATGRLSLLGVILAAIPAGILGDAGGYYVGRYYGRPLLEKHGHRLRIGQRALAKSDSLFAKYGPFALVLGRFSFLTRGLVALLAGMSRMRQRVFWPVNVVGGVAWALGFALTGYAFGYSFLYLEGRLGRVLAFTVLVLAGIYALYRLLRRYAPQFTREDLAVALVAVGGGALFGILADRIVAVGGANRLDARHAALVDGLSPIAPVLGATATVTSLTLLGAVALALLAFLAYRRLAWEAGLVGLGTGGAILLVAVLRPLLGSPDGHAGFPSATATVVPVLLGAGVFIVASHARKLATTLAVALAGAAATVLLALALLPAGERPTDVAGGLALGVSWLALSILFVEFALKRERREPPSPEGS